jgi:hypothetical protein
MSVSMFSIIAFVLLLSDRLVESEIYVLSWFLGYIPILTFAPQRSELDLCGVEEVDSSSQVFLPLKNQNKGKEGGNFKYDSEKT